MVRLLLTLFMGVIIWVPVLALAANMPEYTLVIKDHHFQPEVLEIPANTKVKVIIHNQDPTPEEFESDELRREKVIGGGKKGIIFIGPLKAGTYPYVGEFHADQAKGSVVVK